MKTIILRPFYYRSNEQIRLDFEQDAELSKVLENVDGMIWSKSKGCWYIRLSEKNKKVAVQALSDKAIVDTTLIDIYLKNRKRLTSRFAKGTFFIVLIIISGIAAASFEYASQRDIGTIGTDLFSNLIADSFTIWRFPLLTIFWGHFGGIKSWITVISYLFIDCMIYSFIIERAIALLLPVNKKYIENAILTGELQL